MNRAFFFLTLCFGSAHSWAATPATTPQIPRPPHVFDTQPFPGGLGSEGLMSSPNGRYVFIYSPTQERELKAAKPCEQKRARGMRFTEAVPEGLWESASRPHRLDDAVMVGRGRAGDIEMIDICPNKP